jgi:hypothetical protein
MHVGVVASSYAAGCSFRLCVPCVSGSMDPSQLWARRRTATNRKDADPERLPRKLSLGLTGGWRLVGNGSSRHYAGT